MRISRTWSYVQIHFRFKAVHCVAKNRSLIEKVDSQNLLQQLRIRLMKYFYHICLLLLFVSCKKESFNEELLVKIDYCKYENRHAFLRKFKLLKEGVEIRNIEVDHKKKIRIPNLSFGNYVVQYKSIYNRLESLKFTIDKIQKKEVTLCVDKFDYSTNKNLLLIDQMKVNDVLNIVFETTGCFHSSESELKIKKNVSGFLMLFKEEEMKLSHKQFQLLREFEIELRSNHSSGCSTSDRYSMFNERSYDEYAIQDNSCQWNGFSNLFELLKIKS